MTIRREPSGRWRAVLKSGRQYVAGRTFDTRREAQAWLSREQAALRGGVDPRAGRETVRALLPQWLEVRRSSISAKTYATDADLRRSVPTSLGALSVRAVTDREVQRVLVSLRRSGLAESSVTRFRASLSAFFVWCVRERLISVNPVTSTRVPRQTSPRVEMYPFSEQGLDEAARRVNDFDPHLAQLLLVAGWTGLRWSELRAMRVRSFVEVPLPLLVVDQAAPEGVAVKSTKSGKVRRVPVADRVLGIVRECAAGKGGEDLLFTTASGHRLHAAAVKRAMHWDVTGAGRRIHDLRHTAACLWLARGVDPGTVQAWMGHSSIATTNLYLHHLGTAADRAALDRLNAPGHAGGTQERDQGDEQSRKFTV